MINIIYSSFHCCEHGELLDYYWNGKTHFLTTENSLQQEAMVRAPQRVDTQFRRLDISCRLQVIAVQQLFRWYRLLVTWRYSKNYFIDFILDYFVQSLQLLCNLIFFFIFKIVKFQRLFSNSSCDVIQYDFILQFILKHDEWRSLREVEPFPSSICPSNPRTLLVVKSLIRQIVSFHPDIQYLHIGSDEVWHLGLCSVCTKRAAASKYGKSSLYLEHILVIAQYIQETYPYLKIIIWDDMLRSIDLQVLNGILLYSLIATFDRADLFMRSIFLSFCRTLHRQICGTHGVALQSQGQFFFTRWYFFFFLF